jgi:GNAT superfamily N-acetyltransferase
MPDEPRVRTATPADLPVILELVRKSLGQGSIPRDPGFWSWKHEKSPFGPSPSLLAEAGGEVVGLRVFMRWSWCAGAKVVSAVRAVDTATHPSWRGKGIFSQLTLALVKQVQQEGVAFVFNTPNEQSRPGYLKMGWTSLGRVSMWVAPLRPVRLARALVNRTGGRNQPQEVTPLGLTSVAQLLDQPGLEALLEQPPDADQRLTTVPTLEYLRWRYCDVPGFTYHAAWALLGREGAVAVFRLKQRNGLNELRLCELVVGRSPQSRRLGRELCRGLLTQTGADYSVAVAAGGTPEQQVLMGSGFIPAPRVGPVFTIRPLCSNGGPDPLRRPSWRLSIGSLELF